ncbi:hypothetical protein EDB86DRAFT_3249515 [Lactarius hatsudake]|nr:hypothetical protein EDB86DRAFT_3249515 [Lactarius hatsudake]
MIWSKKPSFRSCHSPPMPGSPFTRSGDRDMSIAVYAGGRSNGSPSAEAKPHLDGATLMLALRALNTPDPCEIFVVWMLRDRRTPARSVGSRAGAGKGNESQSPGSGLEWLGMMGNGGIGGCADHGVGGTGSERERIPEVGDAGVRRRGTETGLIGEGQSGREVCILEKAVIVATREFFDSVAGEKAGHEIQASTTNLNASRIPLVRTYMLSVARPPDGMTNSLSLGTMPRLLDRHRCSPHNGGLVCSNAIGRVASEVRGNWRKGGCLKIIPARTSGKDTIVEERIRWASVLPVAWLSSVKNPIN